MLASLLPGLRELRAPLAAGYLWLVTGWLALAGTVPRPDEVSAGIARDVYDLAAAAGRVPTLAAVTFAAYVVGVLSVELTAASLPQLRMPRRRPVIGTRQTVARPSPGGRRALREAVLDELAKRVDGDPALARVLEETRAACEEPRGLSDPAVRRLLIDIRVDVDRYATSLESDLAMVPLRLLAEGKRQEIYGEADRLRAEAEFRGSAAVPMVALFSVLSWRASPWFLLGLLAPALLVLEAFRSAAAGTDVLAESIHAHAATSPVLNDLQASKVVYRSDWVEQAARKGRYPRAMARFATALEQAHDPTAVQWFRAAAENGERTAMFWLANHLHRAGDPDAGEWYARAAAQGHPEALTIVALDEEAAPEAADLKSAYAGDPAAMTRAGELAEQRGRTEDAKRWYREAARAGHRPARQAMAALLRRQGMEAPATDWDREGGQEQQDVGHDTTETSR